MSENTPPDFEARALARFELSKNIVVEAGAGTGKTSLLIGRILSLLLGPAQAPPISQIVALTFTDKAAGEIKMRLARCLSEAAAFLEGAVIDDEAAARAADLLRSISSRFSAPSDVILERCRRALVDFDRAPIGTIHAFASGILRLYPIEAGVDPDFSVDDSGRLFNDLFESEWAQWLDEELGENPSRKEEWLWVLTRAPISGIEALCRALCREGVDFTAACGENPAAAAGISELAAALLRAAKDQPQPSGTSKIGKSLSVIMARLNGMAQSAAKGDAAAWDGRDPEVGEIATKDWPKSWNQAFSSLYARARALALKSSAAQDILARRACGLVLPFVRKFNRSRSRRGFVSFDGILSRARDLVRDHLEVRDELKNRYRAFLIDEFQDTDPLQGELLLFLAEEAGGRAREWTGARLSPGRIFVVGDPKQSIYRFRGADIAAYQKFCDFILASPGSAFCALTANFRSPAEMLSPINAIFPSVLRPEKGVQPEYRALEPARFEGRKSQDAAVEFVGVRRADDGKISAEESRRAQFSWAARWISENCGSGKNIGFKDAAILLRSASALSGLLDALKTEGVPYATDVEKNFYGAPEILDFLNLLRALNDPEDRIALTGLLRSPLCALEDAHILRLSESRAMNYLKTLPSGLLPQESMARVRALFSALGSLRLLVGREPLGDLIRRILEQTPLLEISARVYYGEQSAANILKLARMAWESSEASGLSLGEFIEAVRLEMDGFAREGESPLADERLDAVRILTVHKAKGLEFPVVFLVDACAKPRPGKNEAVFAFDWNSQTAGVRIPGAACGAGMAWIEDMSLPREKAESARLLYVAMTRAKEKLFVMGGIAAHSGSLAAWLNEAGAWPLAPEAKELPLKGCRVPARWIFMEAARAVPVVKISADAKILAADASLLTTAWKKRLHLRDEAVEKPWIMTPTKLANEPDKSRFHIEDDERNQPSSAGALVGSVCHKALESWNFQAAGDVRAAAENASLVLRRLEPAAPWPAIEKEAADILSAFFNSEAARDISRAEVLGREIPFIVDCDGAVMRGSIDVLYRLDGRLIVADYKSGKIPGKIGAAARKKYAVQGEAYCRAVQAALGERPEFRLIFLREPGRG
ncbi:MAG: UvrD-helicase domain-containing protein [Elusimicrobiota bacterium]